MNRPSIEELRSLDFWQSPESHVMVNLRSKKALDLASEVEARLAQGGGLRGCVWVATSGSSGRARFVALSKSGLLNSAAAVNRHLKVTAADRWLCALPEFHVGGLGIYARAVMSSSEVVKCDEPWDAQKFYEALVQDQITLTSLVPTQVHDLVSLGYQSPESLRVVVVGGERMDGELGRAARNLNWPVLQTYGMTETGSQVATEPLSALACDYSGQCLHLLSIWRVRKHPADDRLQIKGEALGGAYLELSRAGKLEYSKVEDEDTWFTTSDRVEIRRSGERVELCVLGRVDDVIKILGEQVSLIQLNQSLRQLIDASAEIDDGFLMALPDQRKGHRIVAALVLSADKASARRLIEVFNAQVEAYERIDEYRVIDEIPRSALGKVQRLDLAKLYENAQG